MIVGAHGIAGHIFYGSKDHEGTLYGSMDWYRDYMAVTGALHMMRREVYNSVQGYDERFDISYSDIAFCLRVRALGYRVLYDPFVRVIHYESQSRDRTPSAHDTTLAINEFRAAVAQGDPYFNENLSYAHAIPRLRQPFELAREAMSATSTHQLLPEHIAHH